MTGAWSPDLQNQNLLILWLYCHPLVWLAELLGQPCQEPPSLDTWKRREGFSHATLFCYPHPGRSIHPISGPSGMHSVAPHAFEDFAFLWHLIPCSPWPGSQLLQNICPKLPYQNNTAFSKATVNTTCSQKYNPYYFSFPKTVGEFLQHLNPLLLSSFISTWPGGLKKTAGRQRKYKTRIFE